MFHGKEFEKKRFVLQEVYHRGETDIGNLMRLSGMPKSTLYRNLGKLEAGNSLERAPGSGRPRKIQIPRHKQILNQLALQHPAWPANRLAMEAHQRGVPLVSPDTVLRSLKSSGILKLVPKKVPKLTPAQKEARVDFCRAYLDFDFQHVCFTDESKFEFYRTTQKLWSPGGVRREKPVTKFSPSVMVWGGISVEARTTLFVTTETIDSEAYCDILNAHLLPCMQQGYPDGFWYLQQDNARIHTSRFTKSWMQRNSVFCMEWPANSPDLNCIEKLWDITKDKIEKELPEDVEIWRNLVIDTWNNVEVQILHNLINGTRRRMERCH